VLPSANQVLVTFVALVVTVVWALATILAIIERDYTGLSIVTPVMLVVTGCLFAFGKRNGNGNGKHA